MTLHNVVAVCYGDELAGVTLCRDWADDGLVVACTLLACVTGNARSFEETCVLIDWLNRRAVQSSGIAFLVEELWGHRRRGELRGRALREFDDAPKPRLQDKLEFYGWASLMMLVVDVTRGCVHRDVWKPSDAGEVSFLERVIDDSHWSSPNEIGVEEMIQVLTFGRGVAFDTLLGGGSPAYDYLANPQQHFAFSTSSDAVGCRSKPLDQPPANAHLSDYERMLTPRSLNCLRRAGVTTFGELVGLSLFDLANVRNLSRMCLWEIDDFLEPYGLSVYERWEESVYCCGWGASNT